MAQQSSNPTPTSDAAQQQKKMPYGGRDTTKMKPMTDSDPEAKKAMQALFASHFLSPGTGLGTKTWNPRAGLEREHQRRMAQGMSAKERMNMFMEIGATDRDGMMKVFDRAYAPNHKAFMLVKGGR
jgi:hypothetical protein